MGTVVSCCCSCCDKSPNKHSDYYHSAGVIETSPKSYDNTIHVSEIYGNNSEVELAPSDNPTTSTFFQSILHPPRENNQQPPEPVVSQNRSNNVDNLPAFSIRLNTQDVGGPNFVKPTNHKPVLNSTNSLQQNRQLRQEESNGISERKSKLQKHSNSCSTIYVDDSTVSQPNWKAMIRCVSIAIHSHIVHRKSNKSMDIFDEKLHPISRDPVPDDYDRIVPEQKTIYRFLRVLFTAAQLTAECAIVTLVYLERVLSYGELDLCPSNWKRLVLGALMLASKVWDDQAVWNVDFCQILKDITVNEMNELEREYVQLLQFNVDVASSIYAKYYFDLRQIAKENQISFSDELLTKEKAIKLEALSIINNRLQEPYSSSVVASKSSNNHNNQQQSLQPLISLRRSASVELTQSARKSLLILS